MYIGNSKLKSSNKEVWNRPWCTVVGDARYCKPNKWDQERAAPVRTPMSLGNEANQWSRDLLPGLVMMAIMADSLFLELAHAQM